MKYISILRGINVGGHNKIMMADLKCLYKKLGFGNIVTYIQSGNVIFDCLDDNHAPKQIIQSIEKAILNQYGFSISVILRTYEQLNNAQLNNPFGEFDLAIDGSKYFLTLLSEEPSTQNCELLMYKVKDLPEQIQLDGTHIYTCYPNGAGRSKLTNNLMENKLKVNATSRNWKTVIKLLDLSKD